MGTMVLKIFKNNEIYSLPFCNGQSIYYFIFFFWERYVILSNCRKKPVYLFYKVWILFFSFLKTITTPHRANMIKRCCIKMLHCKRPESPVKGFNCLKARATSRRQFTFYHYIPRNSWYSFYRPRKYERLSRPWSHPVVLIPSNVVFNA